MAEAIRIFVGSGEASVLERKVLIYSLQKHASRPLDIRVFNGTHDTVEQGNAPPVRLGMPIKAKYRNVTEFGNYRFLIPRLCSNAGRAIWLDSDTVCLTDIAELFDTFLDGHDVIAKRNAYGDAAEERWGLSVSLYDCSRCRFDLEQAFDEIDEGKYSYADLHQLTPRYLAVHPMRVGPLDSNWNVFDRCDRQTRLIHFTNLMSQPWKFRDHPYGDIWFSYFAEARHAKFITDDDIELAIVRAYARPDLMKGNDSTFRQITKEFLRDAKRTLINRFRRLGR